MQDTSFAIHPGNENTNKIHDFFHLGNVKTYERDGAIHKFISEHGFIKILFYREDIVRIIMNPHQEPTVESTFAIAYHPGDISVEMIEDKETFTLKSNALTVIVHKNPLLINFYDSQGRLIVEEASMGMGYNNNKEVICFKQMADNDHFYGFGEKTSFLDKRGEKMTMWNSDVYAPHNPEIDALYESIPFFMTLRIGIAHGIFFDNSHKTIFDMKSSDVKYSFKAEGGQLDYYLMAGPSPKDVLEQYTTLTGRMPIPPKWSLGYHQSRYSYKSEQEVREVAEAFIEKEIPVDAIYLDIHYMDGYRVFTFDRDRFHTPDKMISDLKKNGIHIVPIVDPGVKEDPEYATFKDGMIEDRFCKYLDGKIYYGDVWPGNSAFPDFMNADVRKWWGDNHRFYADMGIEGIWNDMNEPAVFNETKTMDTKVMHNQDGRLKTHREMHNLYGLMMGEATYTGMKELLNGKRPFLLTRAGYSGVQRYAAVWTGDNRSFWEHLAMSIPMCLNLGVSGVPFTGPDVGGFAHDTNPELLTRWTQVGAFYPYFRNHSAIETVRQEPWAFGEKYEKIIRKFIQLRYIWLPHLYSLFAETSKTGTPVMRPLFMEYPEDENTYNLSDQFMIGNNVIIAPILQPSTKHRVVYLPEGKWYDYWTDEVYEGGQHILTKADLDTLPILIKEGSILVHGSIKQSTKFVDKELFVNVFPMTTGQYHFTLYEDDGETFEYEQGAYLEKCFEINYNENAIDITIKDKNNQYKPGWNELIINVHSYEHRKITINGITIDKKDIRVDEETKVGSIMISM